jgi:pentatricopeptide repeat domain-containing protein 1
MLQVMLPITAAAGAVQVMWMVKDNVFSFVSLWPDLHPARSIHMPCIRFTSAQCSQRHIVRGARRAAAAAAVDDSWWWWWCRYLDKQGVYIMAGLPTMLAVEALFDMSLLNCRPSVVAAALLYAERRQRGAVPFWPSVLAQMTGYEDLTTPELACAVRAAQKLCKKVLYMQVYKNHSTNMAVQVATQLQQQQQQQPVVLAPGQVLSPSGTGTSFLSTSTPAPGAVVRAGASMSCAYPTGSTGSASNGLSRFVPGHPAPAAANSCISVPGLSMTGIPEPPAALPCSMTGAHAQMPLNPTFSAPLASSGQLPVVHAAGVPVATPLLQAQVEYSMLAQFQCQPYHVQQQQQLRGALQVVNGIPVDFSSIAGQQRAANTGCVVGQVGDQTVFASPAAFVAAGAAVDGEMLTAPAAVAAVPADVAVGNVAYSLGLLGLEGSFDGTMNVT